MSFSINLSISGDIGPGGGLTAAPAMIGNSVERAAFALDAGERRMVTFYAPASPTLGLFAIWADDHSGLFIGINGAPPEHPFTNPHVTTGLPLAQSESQGLGSVEVLNSAGSMRTVHILVLRDATVAPPASVRSPAASDEKE
jgi:hypothetical protein